MASAEQDQWVEVCDAFRAQLAKALPLMPAMDCADLAALAGAIDTALWNEAKARTFDEAVEERRRTLEREAAFGG